MPKMDADSVKPLIAAGANVNVAIIMAKLHCARAASMSLAVVKVLLVAGADIDRVADVDLAYSYPSEWRKCSYPSKGIA